MDPLVANYSFPVEGTHVTASAWTAYPDHMGHVLPELRSATPDFLVISTPKTGSGWLYENLRRHPSLFMADGKEQRYFDLHWRQHDINFYLRHFVDGIGRVKGEASPTYVLLPRVAIAAIRRLNPAMKLIFVARNPVAQAWSLMKHNFRYREDNFRDCHGPFDSLAFSDYVENFLGDYALSLLDHLGIYQRWRQFFPAEQFWVGTLEEIETNPRGTLNSIMEFLEVDPAKLSDSAPVNDVVFPGIKATLERQSELVLRTAHRRRARRFAHAMRQWCGKDLSHIWRGTLEGEVLSQSFSIPRADRLWHLINGQFYTAAGADEGVIARRRGANIVSTCHTTLVADFPYELNWLQRLVFTPSVRSPSVARVPEAFSMLIADQRLKALLDNQVATARAVD